MEFLVDCATLDAAVDKVAAELANHAHGLSLCVALPHYFLNGCKSLAAYDAVFIDVNQDGACHAVLILALGLKGVANSAACVRESRG